MKIGIVIISVLIMGCTKQPKAKHEKVIFKVSKCEMDFKGGKKV
jgi:hypothetical protein